MEQHIIEYIHAHYRKEGSVAIAKRFGLNKALIRYHAQKAGLVVDKDAVREHKRQWFYDMKDEDYKVNPARFRSIREPEVAYLLGLLWADGSLYAHPDPKRLKRRIALSIIATDMKEIKSAIMTTGKWNMTYTKFKKRQLQCRVETSNMPLYEFLRINDYTSKSASPDKILSLIPDHLKHYWFRGLFDGDGCLHLGKCRGITIASCFEQDWTYMENICNSLSIGGCRIDRMVLKKSKSSSFRFSNIHGILAFCAYIYRGYDTDKIGLTRKHNKYLNLLGENIEYRSNRVQYCFKETIYDRKNKTTKTIRCIPINQSPYPLFTAAT